MERAHERHLCTAKRVPADDRRDRLVEVGDVVAPTAQLLAQAHHGERAGGDVRDGAVCGDADRRELDKRELLAACDDFADGHLLQSFSLVGLRGDADLMLLAEAENLERIHEFHVVLSQSGLMKWASVPYSFLGMRKPSEYSDDERVQPR